MKLLIHINHKKLNEFHYNLFQEDFISEESDLTKVQIK